MELWATLPSLGRMKAVEDIFDCSELIAVRLNTGVYSPFSPRESLQAVIRSSSMSCLEREVPVWVDLDGRQLRVKNWSYPKYGGKLCLNRSVTFGQGARINFRGDGWYNLINRRGKTVFIDPMPKSALGCGQTVNIDAKDLKVAGPYLTGLDKQYITEALRLGINRFMLSFFEGQSDIDEVIEAANGKKIELILKIENDKGFQAYKALPKKDWIIPMAARDDWYINSCGKASFLRDLAELVKIDDRAIVASRIFSSLEKGVEVSLSDWEDLALMESYGYKTFMLSDGICQYRFKEVIAAWNEYCRFREEIKQ
jgi:hypothetical protein